MSTSGLCRLPYQGCPDADNNVVQGSTAGPCKCLFICHLDGHGCRWPRQATWVSSALAQVSVPTCNTYFYLLPWCKHGFLKCKSTSGTKAWNAMTPRKKKIGMETMSHLRFTQKPYPSVKLKCHLASTHILCTRFEDMRDWRYISNQSLVYTHPLSHSSRARLDIYPDMIKCVAPCLAEVEFK